MIRVQSKPLLWTVIGLAFFWVLALYEYPIFHAPNPHRAHLATVWFFIVPHATAGTTALLLGPLLFSTRFRQRYPQRHRLLGKLYVICICIAAPFVVALGWKDTGAVDLYVDWSQTILWLITTLIAFICARNGHYSTHREWMIRSYALTATFLMTRILGPFQFYASLSDGALCVIIIALDTLCILLPDIAFSWKAITTRRR